MKQLCLIRHAKSAWEYSVSDKDRPLKESGVNDAHLVSLALKSKLAQPDIIYSSHASRALQTASIFIENLQIPFHKLVINPKLYDFDGANLTTVVKDCDNKYSSLMIFGHNYALTSFSNIFGNINIDNVTTAGVVVINFDISSWADIENGNGNTQIVLFPKHLK
jgi:phosphohistidine phosphatase